MARAHVHRLLEVFGQGQVGGEERDLAVFDQHGAEYDACPEFWIANHFAAEAEYPIPAAPFEESAEIEVETAWTIVPCTQDFENQEGESVTIFIQVWNEFEQPLSVFANVNCWAELFLDDEDLFGTTFFFDTLGSAFAQSRLRSTAART